MVPYQSVTLDITSDDRRIGISFRENNPLCIRGRFAPFTFRACSTGQPTSYAPRRVETPSPEGPADLETFQTCTGRPVCFSRDFSLPVVLLPDRGNTRLGRVGTQLAAGPSQVCIAPSEPSPTDTVQDQRDWLSPSTLKVYVAAIAANHDPVEGKSLGKHDWVIRFLRGARRLNHPAPLSIPSWDLSLVLRALQQGPFEPLQTVEPKFLSIKTLLLLALASVKRVGDLHAFSVDYSCLDFGLADSQIIPRPRPGYVNKIPTTW